MRIAIAQIDSVTGDLEGNADRIAAALRRAREQGCDLVVTPEMSVTGYLSCDLLEVDGYVRANRDLLVDRIAAQATGLTAVVGFVDFEEGEDGHIARRYNAAAVLRDGRVQQVAHKQNLCRYRFYDETRYFTPGASTTIVPLPVGAATLRAAVTICEDLWDEGYDVSPYRDAVEAGADLVLVLNASPFEVGKWRRRIDLIRSHQEYRPLPLVYANNVGLGDNLKDIILFDGRSMVFDASGRMVACGALLEDELIIADLDDNLRGGDEAPLPAPSPQGDAEDLHRALTFALRDYCRVTGFTQVVVGVSGGVDSALVTALAVAALGPENVLGVSLPSRYNCEETQSDAATLCRNLGCEHVVMPIEELYNRTLAAFEPWSDSPGGVTLQNFQARLRGLLLMGISNDSGRLLVATGNKTEVGLGYCTLYGDMAGGICLIGDLNKQDVYALSEHIKARAGSSIIPDGIIKRVPSAELADGQTDPFDYPVVAPMVDDLIARLDPANILQRFRDRALGERYAADVYDRYDEESFRGLLAETCGLYHRAAYKRSQSSPIVIVSRRAMGFDLRETIINHWSQGV